MKKFFLFAAAFFVFCGSVFAFDEAQVFKEKGIQNKIDTIGAKILNENKREVIKGVSNESKGIETLKEENIPNEIIKYSMEAYSL